MLAPRLALLCAVVAGACSAPESRPGAESRPAPGGPAPAAPWTATGLPQGELYRPYVADPYRAVTGLTSIEVRNVNVPSSGNTRYGVRLGGRFGVARWHPAGEPDRGVQLDVDGGFNGIFDRDNSTDNLGWDGVYGLYVSWLRPGWPVLRFGVAHRSSHLGDEYIESTGATRINYTREEFLAGASWNWSPSWRSYAEYGHAYDLRNKELQDDGRVQYGLEFEPPAPWFDGVLGWYAAADVSSFEADDWDQNLTLQSGLVWRLRDRAIRIGAEYHDGRVPIGELSQSEERYFALGAWFEL